MWTASSLRQLEQAETKLLSNIQNMKVYNTDVGDGLHIHTVEAGSKAQGTPQQPPLVLTHGYGMGLCAYHLQLPVFSRHIHCFATDWLGYGLSSRPTPFTPKGVRETERFFVESLERWREVNKLDKMILCGHSLGGYLSVAYAEAYPHRVHKLILASPVGVPERPEGHSDFVKEMPLVRKTLFKTAQSLWERGYTPGDLVRWMGPLGARAVRNYSQKRFQPHIDRATFGDYMLHNTAAPPSGERALGEILYPMAFAKEPLCHRIPKLDPLVPVTMVYGDSDWMDSRHAEKLKPGPGQTIDVHRVPAAGHQLFMDNPAYFNRFVLKLCGIEVELDECFLSVEEGGVEGEGGASAAPRVVLTAGPNLGGVGPSPTF